MSKIYAVKERGTDAATDFYEVDDSLPEDKVRQVKFEEPAQPGRRNHRRSNA